MKTVRIMLLVSVQLCWMSLASGRALAANASSAWSNLWRTPDQQGQSLLEAGEPGKAAGLFHDPRLRAYADLQAARNHEAAKLLQPFTDAQSEYNRGNALAKAGQLQDALAAYDAALKQTPADKDIRHNRDLVERALRQQQKSPQQSPNGGQNGRKSGSSGQQQHSGAGQRKGSGSQQSNAGGQRSSGGSQGSSNVAQNGGISTGSSGQQQAGAGSSGTSKETPEQAQRDAAEAAALARQRQQKGNTGNNGQATAATRPGALQPGSKNGDKGQAPGMATPRQKPETEKQLALDQWLRQIPDSPAGLLQRKFLIEHMMKQQGGDEPPESGP